MIESDVSLHYNYLSFTLGSIIVSPLAMLVYYPCGLESTNRAVTKNINTYYKKKALAYYHALGTIDVFASCLQGVWPWPCFLSFSVPNHGGVIYTLLSSLLMSPNDRCLASTSLLTSRPIYPTDTGHLYSNIPWAPQAYLCHLRLAPCLIFSITRYSVPCKTHSSHAGLHPMARSPLYSLPVPYPGCLHSSESSELPSGQTCLLLHHSSLTP